MSWGGENSLLLRQTPPITSLNLNNCRVGVKFLFAPSDSPNNIPSKKKLEMDDGGMYCMPRSPEQKKIEEACCPAVQVD